ncbi:MAG: D-glycerate dehydrogenase [Nitrospira sp.]|uniref:Glyoxylate reductase n=1 Tax=Nitrospira defluvii TaxID=330214 RepID=A0ABM8RRN3_9BACT|nr:D-glycerate dehydrogenase [Nitrospira defluvii]MCS6329391.1 D-glycerate dehydrogenase [Nitrospira sp.]CAE6767970.1 Glyoxylate reductase [Nitrospira defluvii]
MAAPRLYISRLLPDPVMAAARQQYQLLNEPRDAAPAHDTLAAGLCEADAAICTLTDRIDASMLAAATRLTILANYAVGYNNIDLAAASARGIVVTNTPDVLTDSTADLTWALLLAVARRVAEGDAYVRSGDWSGWAPTQMLGTDVSGKTLGIIGMGRIGQAVAQRATGFNMRVCYTSRTPRSPDWLPSQWEVRSLPDLLKEADFVSLHVPLTPDTHHLIGARQLALMKPTAFLINTSRGPVVEESALVDALLQRRLAGAGLDVFEQEPLFHPSLRELRQVVLLPHLGSATLATRVRMGMICLENIAAICAGRAAPNQVNQIEARQGLSGSTL